MFQKIRIQLLAAFLLLCLLSVIQTLVNVQLNIRKTRVEDISQKIKVIQLNVMLHAKALNDFFTFETIRSDFFVTHQSIYLDQYNNYQDELNADIDELATNYLITKIDRQQILIQIRQLSDSLALCINQIDTLIFARGFKDYGIEGKMRGYAHTLENKNLMELSDLLMLRRHEKDYIIRNEPKYITQFNTLANRLIEEQIGLSTDTSKNEALPLLRNYYKAFNAMVAIDHELGIKTNSALRSQLDHYINTMMWQTETLNQSCNAFRDRIYAQIQYISSVLTFIILFLGILLSIILSRITTRRITMLSQHIAKFVESCFTDMQPMVAIKRNDEIGQLIGHFELMQQKIIDQINYLEVKVAERTEEINIQKEQILKQNRRLLDSMRYALNIQEALLPNPAYIAQSFPEHFVCFKPKDMVSGDFYWFKRIQTDTLDVSVIAVADCTGHGVPGGFMSMLGIAFLNDVVMKIHERSTADLLNRLRTKVLETLASKENGRKLSDGMDMALVIIDHKTSRLQFSGALRPLIIVRNGHIQKIKGDNMPIGRYLKDPQPFQVFEENMQTGDMFYLFSDGFADQENGTNGKKYLSNQLNNLLKGIAHHPCELQRRTLELEFKAWRKDADQTDDVLVAGFRYMG
jgi:serine phosphatase RsbU (regulator of sigma subunit)